MLNRILIMLISFFLVATVLASEKKGKVTSVKDQKDGPPPFTREMVAYTVSNIKKTVLKGKNEDGDTPLQAMQIMGFARSFDIYTKNDDIEKVTKISRDWFMKCRDALKAMHKPRAEMETALLNKNKKKYKEAKLEYKKHFKVFEKLIKNPKKAKRKKSKTGK